ncbi:MAG: coproporphyrinogen dehydrogenase HemZ [Eubacteriales bacterium]|nr:coproporphyrinogen dehydrogenase HemZ [Eubacteriales bacterium]
MSDTAIKAQPAPDGLAGYMDNMEPELMNITRLFGMPDVIWTAEPKRFSWRMAAEGEQYLCTAEDGESGASAALRDAVPAATGDARLDELHRKRAARRLCKNTLYRLCRDVTGMQPPWGSLTGVRPTHLIYESLAGQNADAPLALRLDRAAESMRRGFDVTEDKALLARDVVEAQLAMLPPDDHAMDVYIGIPFCTTRCAYCSFSSGEIGRGKLVEPYLTALFREMEESAALLKETGKALRAVYVGGGTPTSLNEDQFTRLMERLARLFPEAMEYTVEAGRPDTITPAKLAAIRDAGVGRISINPQTMNDETLRVIGRAHTAQQTIDCYELARSLGFDDINMDVIAALPGEDYGMFAHTLHVIRVLNPDSLTVHTLAVKRSSRLHEQKYQQQEEDVARMVALGRETAHAMGMRAYYLYRQKYMAQNLENVGYARPASICRYNIDNMEETTSVLALGAGGISKCVMRQEEKILRAPNIANIEQYIDRVDEMAARKREAFEEKAKRLAQAGKGA